ncbi:hypothetical protein M3Y99_00289700 [Aphelenchoides fujianensis]|nr:hypothetical protein M3Y99_00289700 [Aphelenchoides fujianensis]
MFALGSALRSLLLLVVLVFFASLPSMAAARLVYLRSWNPAVIEFQRFEDTQPPAWSRFSSSGGRLVDGGELLEGRRLMKRLPPWRFAR